MRMAIDGRSLESTLLSASIDHRFVPKPPCRCQRRRASTRLTRIELLAIGLECALVMDIDLVALLGYAIALNGERDIDLEVIGGEDADSCRGEQGKREQKALHFEVWSELRVILDRQISQRVWARRARTKWFLGGCVYEIPRMWFVG